MQKNLLQTYKLYNLIINSLIQTMSVDSNDLITKKRQLSSQSQEQSVSKPKKKVKKHKVQLSDDENISVQQKSKHKHKKHKKQRSKSKKHKQKSQKKEKRSKKQKKQKQQKEKQKKSKQSQQNVSPSQSQQNKDLQSSNLSSSSIDKKKKSKKSKSKSKQKLLKMRKRIKRHSKSKSKKDSLVEASEDQNASLDSQNKINQQGKQISTKDDKKKRGRKPKPIQQSKLFQVDDVINLDDNQNFQKVISSHLQSLNSKRSRQKIDRLTKIKNPAIKNIIVTKNVQNVPVDHHFSKFNQSHVLQLGSCFYNSTLTQSNIVRDDNKFFIIQILQLTHNQQQFYVYSRWGRVGVTGQISELGPLNRQAAIRHYNQVVQNKIKIGHYKVVEMNYDDYDNGKKERGNKQLQISSKLNPKVQQLIKLIFDFKMMNSHMKQIGYDEKRLPLGKLGQSTITEGYNTLNKLLSVINNKQKQAFEKKKQINQLSGIFYQNIPHDFGYMNMQTFVLDSEQKIKQKLQILSSLQQIQIYNSLLSQKLVNPQLNQWDQKYLRLGLSITPLIPGTPIHRKLVQYVVSTHATTHSKYSLQIQQIFQIRREQDQLNYKGIELGNRQLLWHGSRLTNYVGILSKGLRIAPLEAPSTGYMFGKGVYFADMVSKSTNYCLATRVNNVGLVLLCQVALGNVNQKFQADFSAANLPEGKHSTKGMGQTEPMSGQMLDGVWIPNGKAAPSGVVDSTLLYNQYVVYNPRQIKYRYLFRFKFHFNVTEDILPGIRV